MSNDCVSLKITKIGGNEYVIVNHRYVMRIVLDTNVIIAAFATRGLCADVLELGILSRK